MKVTAVIEGKEHLLAGLQNMQIRADRKRDLFADAGHYMTFTGVPLNFREHGPGWPPVRRGGSPLIDTQRLRQSISYVASNQDVVIGSRLPYAGIHNRGGTVRPRKGKYLAIPLVPPLNPTEGREGNPRKFPNTFVKRSKAGNLLIFRRNGKGIEPIFLLVTSSRIKRRPYLIWKRENLEIIARRWATYVGDGGLALPATGGSTDMGEKR